MILIISNDENTIGALNNKLLLLRAFDKPVCCNYKEVKEYVKKNCVSVAILDDNDNSKDVSKCIEDIKSESPDTSIILYTDNADNILTIMIQG